MSSQRRTRSTQEIIDSMPLPVQNLFQEIARQKTMEPRKPPKTANQQKKELRDKEQSA